MPRATRYSQAYERRRSLQYSNRSSSSNDSENAVSTASITSSPSPSTTSSTSKSTKSTSNMSYLRGRVHSSLQSPQAALSSVAIATESYLRIKKKGALTTWSTRYFVLRGSQLVWFCNKQDAQWRRSVQEVHYVAYGKITTLRSNELGLEIKTTDGKEFVARAFDRGDLARWITAFQRLALKRESKLVSAGRLSDTLTAESTATGVSASEPAEQERRHAEFVVSEFVGKQHPTERRHVSFHNSVLVRTIPSVTDDQIPELFYSREEMEKFSARASSILCRTEEAVSCAYLAIRRPSSISCRDISCRREIS